MITKAFLTGGHATFTVSNPAGEHFTYKVDRPADQSEDDPIWFVACLTGPDNTSDYSYLGILLQSGAVRVTGKSKFKADAKAVLVAQWAISLVWHGRDLPKGYKIDHSGRCSACGKELTTPESIELGLGPVCAKKAGV